MSVYVVYPPRYHRPVGSSSRQARDPGGGAFHRVLRWIGRDDRDRRFQQLELAIDIRGEIKERLGIRRLYDRLRPQVHRVAEHEASTIIMEHEHAAGVGRHEHMLGADLSLK